MADGYGNTLLQGMQTLSGMVHQRRSEENMQAERDIARQNLERQYQLMGQQESMRTQQMQQQVNNANIRNQLQLERERRANMALENTVRHQGVLEDQGRRGLEERVRAAEESGRNRNIQTVDIIDPTNTNRMIKVDPRNYNEEAHRQGNNTGIIGVAGKTPDAAKKDMAKESGKQRFTTTVQELSGAYENLENMGAVVDPKNSTLKNIWERAAASGPGQTVAGFVGTKAQTERDRVEALRSGMMASMKEATGMSAQSLNSNAELMFYMKMATSPTASIAANKAALAYLDKTFGLGIGVKADPTVLEEVQKAAPKQGAQNAAPDRAIQYLQSNPTIPMKEAFKRKYGYLPDGL